MSNVQLKIKKESRILCIVYLVFAMIFLSVGLVQFATLYVGIAILFKLVENQ